LRRELQDHGQRLAELPFAVAVTKRDLMDDEAAAEAWDLARKWGQENGALEVIHISSVARQGLEKLRHLLRRLYQLDS
jgi:ethanolamine utilization protein EutP (predicted NTPase)